MLDFGNGRKAKVIKWNPIQDATKIFNCKYFTCERHSTTGCDENCKYFKKAEYLAKPTVELG